MLVLTFAAVLRRYVFVQSSELLKLNFHPSSLLTIGDMLAFTRKLSDRSLAASAAAIGRVDTTAPNAENPPSATEQMALSGSIMSRVPQRCARQHPPWGPYRGYVGALLQ